MRGPSSVPGRSKPMVRDLIAPDATLCHPAVEGGRHPVHPPDHRYASQPGKICRLRHTGGRFLSAAWRRRAGETLSCKHLPTALVLHRRRGGTVPSAYRWCFWSVLCRCQYRVPTIPTPTSNRCYSKTNRRRDRPGRPIRCRRSLQRAASKIRHRHPRHLQPIHQRAPHRPQDRRVIRFRSSARRCCKHSWGCSRRPTMPTVRMRRQGANRPKASMAITTTTIAWMAPMVPMAVAAAALRASSIC
jgi:hypothetical protein